MNPYIIIVLVNMSYMSSKDLAQEHTEIINLWNKDKNVVKIKSINSKSVSLDFDTHIFRISFETPFVIEYLGKTRLSWIDTINMYCIDKSNTLTFVKLLTILYKQIEKNKADLVKEITITKFDNSARVSDVSTNFMDFELEKHKKSKEIDSLIPTSKSQIYSHQYGSSDNTKNLFTQTVVGKLVAAEFMELWEMSRSGGAGGAKGKFRIEIVDKNIYHWKVKFTDFSSKDKNSDLNMLQNSMRQIESKYGYNYIEADIHIHDTLYPNYPPIVKILRPKLLDSLTYRISNAKMLQLDYWTPARSMSFVVHKVYELLCKHAKVCVDTDLNDIVKNYDGAFLKIEAYLLDLASHIGSNDEEDPNFDTDRYENFKTVAKTVSTTNTQAAKKKDGVVWASGVGYGHNGNTSNWDIKAYLKAAEERDNIIQSILNKIIVEIQNSDTYDSNIYDSLKNSVLITYVKSQLQGTTLLEITKHKEIYTKIFTLLSNLANENGMCLFVSTTNDSSVKSLFDLLSEVNAMCKTAIKYDKTEDDMIGMITTVYDMIKPCYDSYIQETLKKEIHQKQLEETKQTIEQEYIKKMTELRDRDGEEEFKLVDTNYHPEYQQFFNADKHHKIPSAILKRIRDEFVTFSSLPISYDAFVIARPDCNYMTAVRTIMSGPKDTPYECGLFIFDTYINKEFPTKPPNCWYQNTGGKRFNPNLYDSGYVCLSLLGTWRTNKPSETWNKDTSSLLQIYVSIQSQILVDLPYYNEPGHESYYNSPNGKAQSDAYNNDIKLYTMKFAMLDLIKNPKLYPQVEDVVRAHFSMKKDKVLEICAKWVEAAPSHMKADYIETFESIKTEISKL